jgi:hypothetical protein
LLTAAERALAWDPVQRSAIERLRAAQDSSVVSLPLLVAEEFGAREVELLATRIAQEEGRS